MVLLHCFATISLLLQFLQAEHATPPPGEKNPTLHPTHTMFADGLHAVPCCFPPLHVEHMEQLDDPVTSVKVDPLIHDVHVDELRTAAILPTEQLTQVG